MATFLTPKEVADRWQCSPEHVQRLCKAGVLAAMQLGRRGWRIRLETVEAYEAGHTASAGHSNETPKPEPSRSKEVSYTTTVDGFALPADYTPRFPDLWPGHGPTTKKRLSPASESRR